MKLGSILALLALVTGLAEVLVLGAVVGAYFEGSAAPGLGAATLGASIVIAALPALAAWGLVRAMVKRGREVKGGRIISGLTLLLDAGITTALVLAVGTADLSAHATWMPRQLIALATSGEVEEESEVEEEGVEEPEVEPEAEAEVEPEVEAPPADQGLPEARAALTSALESSTFLALVPHLAGETAAGVGSRWLDFQQRAQGVLGWEGADEAASHLLDRYGLIATSPIEDRGERLAPVGRAFLEDVVQELGSHAGRDDLGVPWADLLPEGSVACAQGEPFALEPAGHTWDLRCQGVDAGRVQWEAGRWRLYLGDFSTLAAAEVDPLATIALRLDRPVPPNPEPAEAREVEVFEAEGEPLPPLPEVE